MLNDVTGRTLKGRLDETNLREWGILSRKTIKEYNSKNR